MPQTEPQTRRTIPPRGKARRSTPAELDAFVTEPDLELADEVAEEAGRDTNALWQAGVILAILGAIGLRRRNRSTLLWHPERFKYITRAGPAVAVSAVRGSIEAVNKVTARRLLGLAESLRVGDISLRRFQLLARNELFAGHLVAGSLANGGRARLSEAVLETIAAQLKEQFVFFDAMIRDVEARKVPVAGRFFQRLRQYAASVRGTYYAVSTEAHAVAGFTEERNVLGQAEHCAAGDLPSCVDLTAKSWVPIGSLPKVGQRQCHQNCRCHLIYR